MKRLLLFPMVIVLASLLPFFSCTNSTKTQSLSQEQIDSINKAKADSAKLADSLALVKQHYEDSIKHINDSLESIKLHDAMIKRIFNEFNEFRVEDASDIHEFYRIIDYDAKIMRQEENPKLKKELKSKLVAFCVKNYPLARKAWVQSAKNKLWIEDIDVTYSGRTVTFTGSVFASNAGIKAVYDGIAQALVELHFKRCNFKWSKYADEYTYYTISSDEDNEIY